MLSSGQFGSWSPAAAGLKGTAAAAGGATKQLPQLTKSGKPKRKRPKFIRKVTCAVCGDVANDHVHYGAIACYSCRAFFRRSVNAGTPYHCSQAKSCTITKATRKHCQHCRFQKCQEIGMKASWVMTEDDKREKRERALAKRLQKMRKEAGLPPSEGEEDQTAMLSPGEAELSSYGTKEDMDQAGFFHRPSLLPRPHHQSGQLGRQQQQQDPTSVPASHQYASHRHFWQQQQQQRHQQLQQQQQHYHHQQQHQRIPAYPYHSIFGYSYPPAASRSSSSTTATFSSSTSSPYPSSAKSPTPSTSKIQAASAQSPLPADPFSPPTPLTQSCLDSPRPGSSKDAFPSPLSMPFSPLTPGSSAGAVHRVSPAASPSSFSVASSPAAYYGHGDPNRASSCSPRRSSLPGTSSAEASPRPSSLPRTPRGDDEDDGGVGGGGGGDESSSSVYSLGSPLALAPVTPPPKPDVTLFVSEEAGLVDGVGASAASAVAKRLVGGLSLEALSNQPVMPFTPEESALVRSVLEVNVSATKSIEVRPEIIRTMIAAARSGSVVPYEALVEGYTTCMKRIIKFSSQLDFFQSFSARDQRALLLNNTDMVVNIRSARLLRPGINLQSQLNHVVAGENPQPCSAVDLFKPPDRLEYQQVFQSPWACDAKHEEQFATLMESLFHLEMDATTTILMTLIVLFSAGNEGSPADSVQDRRRCIQTQEFFTQMLYRYLCSTVGKPNAVRLLPEYMFLVSKLEEMARIMVTKRLML